MPGAAHLEMARAAVEAAVNRMYKDGYSITLRNISWLRPVVMSEQPLRIHIGLSVQEGGEIEYEIFSESENDDTEAIVYSKGNAVIGSVKEGNTLDLKTLLEEFNQNVIPADKCYEEFRRMGIDYGLGFQSIEKIYAGTNKVLAKLALTPSLSNTINQFVLHPSLLDAALQSQIGLIMDPESLNSPAKLSPMKPLLLFAMQELEIFGRPTSTMWALVQDSSDSEGENKRGVYSNVHKVIVDLFDEQGMICTRMKFASFCTLENGVQLGNLEKPSIHEKPVELDPESPNEMITVYQESFALNVHNIRDRICANLKTEKITNISESENSVDYSELLDAVINTLVEIVSNLADVRIEDISIDDKLSEYGFDLVKLSELTTHLYQKYQIDINPNSLLEFTSLRSITEYMVQEYKNVFLKRGRETAQYGEKLVSRFE